MPDKPVIFSAVGGKKALASQIAGFHTQLAAGLTAANNATTVTQLRAVVAGLCSGLDTFLTLLVAYETQN